MDFFCSSFIVVPVITVHPISQPGIAGGNVTLTCTAVGFPLPIQGFGEIGDIVWLRNNVVVTPQLIPDNIIQRVPGTTEDITVFTSLTIVDLQLHDVARYSCNASNDLFEPRFNVSDEAELTVLCESMTLVQLLVMEFKNVFLNTEYLYTSMVIV